METSPMMCSCGHPRTAHEHYRRGDDCGACGAEVCRSYRQAAHENVVHFRRQLVRRPRRFADAEVVAHGARGAVVESGTSSAV